MSKTVLITGGAGFIGSCLVRQWVQQDDVTVVSLDKLTYAGNLDSLAVSAARLINTSGRIAASGAD